MAGVTLPFVFGPRKSERAACWRIWYASWRRWVGGSGLLPASAGKLSTPGNKGRPTIWVVRVAAATPVSCPRNPDGLVSLIYFGFSYTTLTIGRICMAFDRITVDPKIG
ncbi:MAG TPA: hypothetical protein VNN62_27865 [Methylomirabilota bacterium]|nr:hypothetical protein [Methylomirabilota bacterium]